MKKTKQQRQLQASNAAHARLQKRAEQMEKRTGKDLYQQRKMYHGACIIRQEKSGRVFTRAEREKVYDDVIRTFW